MTTLKVRLLLNAMLNHDLTAVALSALYPTVFMLSHNWYAFPTVSMAYLFLLIVGSVAILYAIVVLPFRLVSRFATHTGVADHKWYGHTLQDVLLGFVCVAVLFFLLYGTLLSVFRLAWLVLGLFVACAALTAYAFTRKRQRHYAVLMMLLLAVSVAQGAYTYAPSQLTPPAKLPHLSEKDLFQQLTLSDKPNIFLLLYDAYGSRATMRSVFDLDNSSIYEYLQEKGFETYDSFANYWTTWPTVLATFLANHHYHSLIRGHDTEHGRAIMVGLTYNPVLYALKHNGYKVQYIQHRPYLTKEDGLLDYNYQGDSAFTALRVFKNPLFNSVFRDTPALSVDVSMEKQTRMFLHRLDHINDGTGHPWFTFAYFLLPGHFPDSVDWRSGAQYEDTFRNDVRKANDHIRLIVDRILEDDSNAVIIIMGDHGSWRYRDAWEPHKDPNAAFAMNGVSAELVADDIFGIMIAIHSAGRCRQEVYETITPVNVMRAVFACLSGADRLLKRRPPDISLFSSALWLAVKDGKPLKQWRRVRVTPNDAKGYAVGMGPKPNRRVGSRH